MRNVLILLSVLAILHAAPVHAAEEAASEPTSERADLAPTRIDLPSFRLDIPFRTQKDGGRWQNSNCGPAILGMVLDGFGFAGHATDDLRLLAHTYQGTVGMRTGTALQHIAQVAEDLGVPTSGLYEPDGRFHAWSTDEIRERLRLGQPVMPLVRLYLVPGYEGSLPRWGHYLLITGIAPDGFYYSDSLKLDASEGAGRFIGPAQLERAMAGSHIPGQAVAFGGSSLPLLSVSPTGP
jgi:Papain-like cysteine protease AvrRpt2